MKPVRQQRVGRGYLDAVLRDAARPYDFRGGLRRLLNISSAMRARSAYTYGSLPFNLKYLQHSAYGSEWPVAPAPVVSVSANQYEGPQRPHASDGGWYRAEPASDARQARQIQPAETSHDQAYPSTPGVPDYSFSKSVPQAQVTNPQSQTVEQKPGRRLSSERLRQGPPPLVTSRAIGSSSDSAGPPADVSQDGIDNSAAVNRGFKQKRNEAHASSAGSKQMEKAAAHNHFLSSLARKLEAHNFGDQHPAVDHQFGSAESPSRAVPGQLSQSGRTPSRDPDFPKQRYQKQPMEQSAADSELSGKSVGSPVSVRAPASAQPKASTAFHELPGDGMREQLRLMSNLKKKAGTRRTGDRTESEPPMREPVKAQKKPPAKKTQPVVHHTIVRRAAAPAFWERSYLSHASLRIYK